MSDICYSRCPGRFLGRCGNEMGKRFELDRKGGGESVGGSKSFEGCLTDSIDKLSSATRPCQRRSAALPVRPTLVSQFPGVNELSCRRVGRERASAI